MYLPNSFFENDNSVEMEGKICMKCFQCTSTKKDVNQSLRFIIVCKATMTDAHFCRKMKMGRGRVGGERRLKTRIQGLDKRGQRGCAA